MVRLCSGIVRLNPSFFAFLSGVSIAISTNLLTSLVLSSPLTKLETLTWGAVGTFFVAGTALAALASHLEGPHQHWIVYWRDAEAHYGLKEEEVIQGAIGRKSTLITVELMAGLIAALTGVGLLVILIAVHLHGGTS
jgi:hypothetical protein